MEYIPTRIGYTFEGWYSEPECINKITDSEYTPSGNITLYAKWTANTYLVRYYGNGYTGGGTANTTHTYDEEKVLTANGFIREYEVTYNHNYNGSTNINKTATYTFKNWNREENGTGTTYEDNDVVKNLTDMNNDTVILYAQWNSSSVNHTPTRTGYTFGGWYREAECINQVTSAENTVYTPTANITLYAKWIPNTYTVIYNGNGATGGNTASSTHTYDEEKVLTANGFIREYEVTYNHNYEGSTDTNKTASYIFNGWAAEENGAKVYNNEESIINLREENGEEVNLYADWSQVGVSYVPERTGYTFLGWYSEPECINKVTDDEYTPGEDTTLYAKWQVNNYKYTVNYLEKETNNVLHEAKADGSRNYGTAISSNAEIINIKGYKYESSNDITITEVEENVINIYYVIDEAQTKEVSYKVEYYMSGEEVTEDEQTVTKTVQVLRPDELNVEKENINLVDKYIGYKLEKTEPAEIPDIVNHGETIKVYYVKDKFNYTVEYYYDGVEDESKKETLEATYQEEITEYEDKNITGYKFDKVEGLPLTITEVAENNVIKVYYVKDKFNYTIEYYYDGVQDESKTVTSEATYQQEITEYEDKNIVGYKLEKVEGMPLAVTEIVENNVIKVYYVKDKFNYTVEYYYNGEKDESKTITAEATYQDKITEYEDKNITGYKFDKVEGVPLTITEVEENNVIKVYYVIDEENTKELSYIVEYYKDGNKVEEDTETERSTVQILQPDTLEVNKEKINTTK